MFTDNWCEHNRHPDNVSQAGCVQTLLFTAGSSDKIPAPVALNWRSGSSKEEDFSVRVLRLTISRGDLGQDFLGAAYWRRNLRPLKVGGRLVLVGLIGGARVF